jgi:nucleoprotein TPR
LESLRARIASLESSNRDTLAVIEAKSTANDALSQDLQKQHQKALELSQQITTLQQSVQNANSAASSAKFREQSLKQELELAKRNNEWFENELKTKSTEALKFRKEKGARIAELQRLNEESNSNLEALKRTEQALRTRLDEVQKKAEDSLHKIQQLQEAAAKTEEGFRQELESARRLAELQAQQTETHKHRLKEVEAELEKAKDDAADQIGRCQQEAEAERQDREQAEHRIAELEAEIDRLEALGSAQPRPGSIPSTPRQGLNGSMMGRAGSPAQYGTPGSLRSKSAITATQAIDELYKVKGQLATERRRSERLAAEMEELMQGLEAKQPEIEEMQAEHERLQQEVVEMSKFVDQTSKERDRAKKDVRKAESEASTAQAEANILRQQLRDLSAQIKMLLCDLDARERGLDALSAAERAQLERLARGEISEESLEGMTDTDRLISQRLTVFRSISELQEKNQELLKITRQLGAQMESEEALAAKHQAAKDHEEVQHLQTQIENYKDELKSMITRSESYIKERDMFRRMLQHRGQLPPNSDLASMFGQSVDGNGNGLMSTTENAGQKDNANYAALLRELQAHFDQYREEQTVDRRTLKEQAERLSSEKAALQAEISKIMSQVTLANERYEMLHSNYTLLQNENSELQKRSQILSEAAAKQDLRTQQVAEDLIEAKSLVESMRNENANLKAEKKLWKDIQDRLSQDNENLANERSRLNTLIANQQTLQNERDLSESETRRRLQTQVETLETELNSTKRRLNDEVEENKKAQLRKEYDSQQTQKRIDELATNLSQAREELVAAKTTRDHLQARVDELTIELRSAEERVEVLQPRPTPRPGTAAEKTVDNDANGEDDSLTREQELAIELSELKRDLELAKSELESAKSQVEQYKAISQSSEEELESLNATQDEYREEMDRIIAEKDAKIRELEQRAEDIATELTNSNNELTKLRNDQGEVARIAEEQRAVLEAEISRLKDEEEKHATAAQFHQQDLRAQAAIATKAQQDYENELVKHAEAAKLVQTLRIEFNQLKSESAALKAEAESARVTLSQNEASWEEQRDQFERELSELRTRRDDVNAQNKLLHQQLENVGAQITALQQSRSSAADASEAGSPNADVATDRNAEGLRELNTFLRREKEIIEVQYELKIQEAKRLQQQLEYAQSQLDESRLKLEQERRSHADGGRSSVAHKDLMEKLNELNLFRESSITLRNEARQAQSQLADKTKRVEELVAQIQPLETKVRELEHSKETMEGEMHLLQEDRDRWQKRNQDILSKYNRIDPAEMEQLKETIESLRSERDALLGGQQPLKEKLEALESAMQSEKTQWQTSRQRLIDQAKDRDRKMTKENKDRAAERDAAISQRDALQEQLTSLEEQIQTVTQEKEAAEARLGSLQQELDEVKSQRDQALENATQPVPAPQASPALPTTSSDNNEALNSQLAELRKERDQLVQEKQALQEQITQLKQQLETANAERDSAIAEAAEARSQPKAQPSDTTMDDGTEDGQIDERPKSTLSDDEKKALEARILAAEAMAKERDDKAKEIEATMDATLKLRSEKMKAALNKKLSESKETMKAQLEADFKLKLEQEKQIWLAENKSTESTAATPSQPTAKSEETSAPAPPATPSKAAAVVDGTNLNDEQVRHLLSTNPTVKSILANNLKKKLDIEAQKLKEEQAKTLAEKVAEVEKKAEAAMTEAQQKAEHAQAQAVIMAEKKTSLKLNMTENRFKMANAKIVVVETAARETPEKAVSEVWEVAKNAKPPPAPVAAPAAPTAPAAPAAPVVPISTPAPPAAVAADSPAKTQPAEAAIDNAPAPQSNGTPAGNENAEVKVEAVKSSIPQARPQTPSMQQPTNAASGLPVSNIPSVSYPSRMYVVSSNIHQAPQAGNQSRLPQMRGGGAMRGGGRGIPYQARGGPAGRGRGNAGGQRGGMNANAASFSPNAQSGIKRPVPEGGQQGNGGKRPRGGGPN